MSPWRRPLKAFQKSFRNHHLPGASYLAGSSGPSPPPPLKAGAILLVQSDSKQALRIISACDKPKHRHPALRSVQGNCAAHGGHAEGLLTQQTGGPPRLAQNIPWCGGKSSGLSFTLCFHLGRAVDLWQASEGNEQIISPQLMSLVRWAWVSPRQIGQAWWIKSLRAYIGDTSMGRKAGWIVTIWAQREQMKKVADGWSETAV